MRTNKCFLAKGFIELEDHLLAILGKPAFFLCACFMIRFRVLESQLQWGTNIERCSNPRGWLDIRLGLAALFVTHHQIREVSMLFVKHLKECANREATRERVFSNALVSEEHNLVLPLSAHTRHNMTLTTRRTFTYSTEPMAAVMMKKKRKRRTHTDKETFTLKKNRNNDSNKKWKI